MVCLSKLTFIDLLIVIVKLKPKKKLCKEYLQLSTGVYNVQIKLFYNGSVIMQK